MNNNISLIPIQQCKQVGYVSEEHSSNAFNPIVTANRFYKEEPGENIHIRNIKANIESKPSSLNNPSLIELCWLDLSYCEFLTSLSIDLSKLKFLRRLYLSGCTNLENFPEIKDTMGNLTVLMLDQTAILELPSSLHHLVGLEELSLHRCQRLEVIPPSIRSLRRLCKLDLTYCESLETFPSSIFKLKLTKLDLYGCSMLKTFPDILEPAESFAHVNLTKTAIKELPSSLDYLVGLRTLRLNLCSDLELLPNSMVNLNLLNELNCSGCGKLTEIPNDIGRMSSLRVLSLHETSIVNLPESIACLSSLKALDLSDCKKLECIPQLPPFLEQLLAFDCPSVKRVMTNSRFKLPSDSKEGIFKYHFTNSRDLDPHARSKIVADAWFRITEEAYRSMFFCFPGSAVPHWFPSRGKGHSVTLNKDSLNRCNDNRLIGFALCVVLGHVDMDDTEGRSGAFRYRLTFESDGGIQVLHSHVELRNYFYWMGRHRSAIQDHTFLWKYNLESASISHMLSRAHNFTLEITKDPSYFKSCVKVKECGICPLYTKEKDHNAGAGDYYTSFLRFSNNGIEEPSGSKVA